MDNPHANMPAWVFLFSSTTGAGAFFFEGGKGCIGCRNRELAVKMVDMSKMAEVEAGSKAKMEAEKTKEQQKAD